MEEKKGKQGHFKLHIHSAEEKKHERAAYDDHSKHAAHAEKPNHNPNHPHTPNGSPFPKKTIKTVLKEASRQIIASIIILVIGFLLLNWSAYYQIFKSELRKLQGDDGTSPLQEMVEDEEIVYTQKILKTSPSTEIQKKQIPELILEIAPSDNRIIIPRIDQNIPIVRISSESLIRRDWDKLEDEMQDALQGGVVHYPGTSLPGQTGNIVVTGHSSYFPWDSGRFKDVFAILHEVVEGDNIVIFYEQDKYIYEVYEIKIVMPKDIEILRQTPGDKLTLITCYPVGTNLKRLVVSAKPIEINSSEVENKIVRK